MTSTTTRTRGRVRVEPGHKRVRAFIAGHLVADSSSPLLVWEVPYYPAYYLPVSDVTAELIVTGRSEHSPSRGDATVYDVRVGSEVRPGAARRYAQSELPELQDTIRLDWDAVDEWFEEDEPIYTHPRDPYTRVDILASSRRIQVSIDGIEMADSVRPHLLFETGLPERYYLPMTDVRMDLLVPSPTTSHCPYKGTAMYWSLAERPDVAWGYRTPLPESQKIIGQVCFYNERVDIRVDGVLQDRPKTKFS
jgi:uncharacterized protein (DUF427 family)